MQHKLLTSPIFACLYVLLLSYFPWLRSKVGQSMVTLPHSRGKATILACATSSTQTIRRCTCPRQRTSQHVASAHYSHAQQRFAIGTLRTTFSWTLTSQRPSYCSNWSWSWFSVPMGTENQLQLSSTINLSMWLALRCRLHQPWSHSASYWIGDWRSTNMQLLSHGIFSAEIYKR